MSRHWQTWMNQLLVGYARVSTEQQDLTAQLEPTQRNVRLSLGGSIHDPTDPVGRLLFNVLATVAEFEADLISMRTGRG